MTFITLAYPKKYKIVKMLTYKNWSQFSLISYAISVEPSDNHFLPCFTFNIYFCMSNDFRYSLVP